MVDRGWFVPRWLVVGIAVLAVLQVPASALPPGQAPVATTTALDLAGSIRDAQANAGEDVLEQGVRIAQTATLYQIQRLGEGIDGIPGPIPLAGSTQPSKAVQGLLAEHGILLDGDREEQAERLDALPEPLSLSLAGFIDGLTAYQQAADDKFHEGPSASPGQTARVLTTRNQLLDTLADLNRALTDAAPETLATAPVYDDAPWLRIDLTLTDYDYDEDYLFILDVGGSDAYANNAGGNGLADCSHVDVESAAALFDLDTPGQPGDIDYFSVNRSGKWTERSCGKNGGSWLGGTTMLVSGTGSDWYFEKPNPNDPDPADPRDFNTGINGGADLGGEALLLELGGNEAYRAGSVGVNGGAVSVSNALMIDMAGDDLFETGDGGTNGGAFALSISALLIDVTGDDVYSAGDLGTNGGMETSVSAGLVDLDGNDAYITTGTNGTNGAVGRTVFGLPGSAFLLDTGGADTFDEPGTANDCADPGDCTIVPRGILGARIEV